MSIEEEVKKKAEELCNKFIPYANAGTTPTEKYQKYAAKQCALICVDEIEGYRKQIEYEYKEDLYHAYNQEEFWQQVKEYIQNNY